MPAGRLGPFAEAADAVPSLAGSIALWTERDSQRRCACRIAMAQMDWIASFTWNVSGPDKKHMEYFPILSYFQPCDCGKHEVCPHQWFGGLLPLRPPDGQVWHFDLHRDTCTSPEKLDGNLVDAVCEMSEVWIRLKHAAMSTMGSQWYHRFCIIYKLLLFNPTIYIRFTYIVSRVSCY